MQVAHWLPTLVGSTPNDKKNFIDTVGKVTGALKEDYGILGEMAGFKSEANAAQAARNLFHDSDKFRTLFTDGDTVRVKPLNAAELSTALDTPIEKKYETNLE